MLHFVVIKMLNRRICCSQQVLSLSKPTIWMKSCFCNPIYLPILVPSIFCYYREGALGLANPQLLFFFVFSFSFSFSFYLRLPLLLPRPQIKQLGTFILYLTTNLPRLNCLDRFFFSNLQHQFKHGMIQIRLLDHPSKSRTSSKLCTDMFPFRNMRSLHHQSRTYLGLPLPIMKNETYWYRQLTVAPLGDGFSI